MAAGDDDIDKRFFAGEDARKSTTGLPQMPPGRVLRTMEAIAQVGVDKIKSPARIAKFVGAGLALLLVLAFALSRLGVPIPLLSSGMGGLGHIFFGANDDPSVNGLKAKPKPPPPAPTVAAMRQQTAAPLAAEEPLAHKDAQKVEQLGETDKQQLAQLYAGQDLKLAPKAQAAPAPAVDRAGASLSAEQVAQTIGKFQSGYAGCVDRELKRNPGFVGGKIRIVTTVAGSGIVQHAEIQSDDARLAYTLSSGDLGACIVNQTRRIVFPSFAGDPLDIEIPLVVGGS